MSDEVFDFNALVETPEPASQPPKKWRRLPLWAWVIVLPCWLFVIILHMFEGAALVGGARDEFESARGVGIMFGSFLTLAICLGIALFIGLVSKRSRNAYAGTFVALSCLVAFGQVSSLLRNGVRQQNNTTTEQLEDIRARFDDRLRERIASGNYDADLEVMDEAVERLDALAQTATGDNRIAVEVSAALVARVRETAAEYQAALEELAVRPPLDTTWIAEPGDIDDIRARVARFRDANAALTHAVGHPIDEIRRQFALRGSHNDALVQRFAKGAHEAPAYAPTLRMRALDTRLCDELDLAADLLENNWDDWGHDESGQLVMTDDELRMSWNDLIDRVDAIEVEQTRIVRELAGLPPEAAPDAKPEPDPGEQAPATGGPREDDDGG